MNPNLCHRKKCHRTRDYHSRPDYMKTNRFCEKGTFSKKIAHNLDVLPSSDRRLSWPGHRFSDQWTIVFAHNDFLLKIYCASLLRTEVTYFLQPIDRGSEEAQEVVHRRKAPRTKHLRLCPITFARSWADDVPIDFLQIFFAYPLLILRLQISGKM